MIQTRYIPVPAWGKSHEWPSTNSLRSLIANSDKNGFHSVVKKVGKRVLIDEQAFFKWVEDRNKEAQ